MRRLVVFLLAICLVLSLTLAAFNPATATPADKPFVGTWESIDVDGSYQKLTIAGGAKGQYNSQYIDFGASACGKDVDGQPLYAANGLGQGTANGLSLTINYQLYCKTSPKTYWGSFQATYVYDPTTDTLSDGWVTWNRKSAK